MQTEKMRFNARTNQISTAKQDERKIRRELSQVFTEGQLYNAPERYISTQTKS